LFWSILSAKKVSTFSNWGCEINTSPSTPTIPLSNSLSVTGPIPISVTIYSPISCYVPGKGIVPLESMEKWSRFLWNRDGPAPPSFWRNGGTRRPSTRNLPCSAHIHAVISQPHRSIASHASAHATRFSSPQTGHRTSRLRRLLFVPAQADISNAIEQGLHRCRPVRKPFYQIIRFLNILT